MRLAHLCTMIDLVRQHGAHLELIHKDVLILAPCHSQGSRTGSQALIRSHQHLIKIHCTCSMHHAVKDRTDGALSAVWQAGSVAVCLEPCAVFQRCLCLKAAFAELQADSFAIQMRSALPLGLRYVLTAYVM